MFRHLPTYLGLSVFALASAACSLTVPDEDNDGVVRCDNSDECPRPTDGRLEAVCDWGEGQDQGTPKVCWEDYKSVSCGPDAKELRDTYDEADKNNTFYVGCSEDTLGKPSCAPDDGKCDHGEPVDGRCPGPDGVIAVEADRDLAGKDIGDQYCRSFFCDNEWVCAPVGSAGRCAPCDPELPFGEGGCGKLYVAGELSPMYKGGEEIGECENGVGELGTVPGEPPGDDDDDTGE